MAARDGRLAAAARRLPLLLLLGSVLLASCRAAAQAGGTLPLDRIRLPAGFRIAVYARVPNAREMTLAPDGTLFVGTRSEGKVFAVKRGTGTEGGEVVAIASGLREPNGVAFRDGSLYVAEIPRVLRFDAILANLGHPPKPAVVRGDFPKDGQHGWKFIAFGPDGLLYVPVGAPCNICEPSKPVYAALHRMRPDGTGLELYASGIRNTVGFDWDPRTHDLWFTDNGRDWLGDDLPPDELNHAPRSGMNFGYPYCHGHNVADPEYGTKHPCSEFTPPEIDLPAHVAALGMRFYTGTLFPAEYRGDVFLAEHGSWNRSTPSGYQVVRVHLENGRAVRQEPFAEGWLQGSRAWGRPVDVLATPDGALLVSDDSAGAIYRISYGR